LQHYQNLPNKK